MLIPFPLLPGFPSPDHHGEAAESDVPRFAQLPWPDY